MELEKFTPGDVETKFATKRWSIRASKIHTPEGTQTWEQLVSKAPGVVVVAVNDQNHIAVITQNRLLADGQLHLITELPSGWMETDSVDVTPGQVKEDANRELQEELGFKANNLELLTQFQLSNFAVVPYYVMLATQLEESQLPGDEDGHIKIEWLPLEEAEKRLLKDQIPTAQVYTAIQAYKEYLATEDYSK